MGRGRRERMREKERELPRISSSSGSGHEIYKKILLPCSAVAFFGSLNIFLLENFGLVYLA